jgi:hypothetical protein
MGGAGGGRGAAEGRAGPAALSAALLALACAGAGVRVDYDREVDFSGYQSFDWVAPPPGALADSAAEGDPFERNSLLDKRVRAAVERELAARGFVRADRTDASFLLNYHVILKERISAWTTWGGGYGWGGWGYRAFGDAVVQLDQFQEGTFVLDVIDPKRNQLTWRGWVVRRTRDGNYDEREVHTSVERILARFPPRAGG